MKLFDDKMTFFKGNTHTHTTVSDGRRTPQEVMREYREAGYDFLALTDHWKVSEGGSFQGMTLLSGVEYDFTFPTQVLHMVALYPDHTPHEDIVRSMDYRDVIARVNERGGLLIAAHPAWSLNTTEFLVGLDGIQMAEVYNTLSGEPSNAPRADAAVSLDISAANGKPYRLVASDDSHFYIGEQCVSFIMVQAEDNSSQSLFAALRAGRFYASQGPQFANVEIKDGYVTVHSSPVSRCTFISNRFWVGGRCREGINMTENIYKIEPGEKFIRVEITDAQGHKAWTSPVSVEN